MILAIEKGTTGTTCLVFDEQAELIGRAYRELEQHFPQPGWVEHDPAEIWDITQAVAGEALEDAGLAPGELHAVGITNQRETVCVWDPDSGEPLYPAIGIWTIDQVRTSWRGRRRYEPAMGEDRREALLRDWRRAVERSRAWAEA